jgi:hypothetical protein
MEFRLMADRNSRRIMIFLLFLVSLAVTHYVVAHSGTPSTPGPEPPGNNVADPASPAVQAAAAPGLAALGLALDEYGRGPAPQPAEAPRTLDVPKSG